jgi:hypothetical protein
MVAELLITVGVLEEDKRCVRKHVVDSKDRSLTVMARLAVVRRSRWIFIRPSEYFPQFEVRRHFRFISPDRMQFPRH